MLAVVGLIATVTPEATVTVALAIFVESALLVPVTVWGPVAAGAVYSPPVDIVPVVELPPLTPSTAHCTPVLVLPETVEVNCCVPFTFTVADVGLIEMLTDDAVTVTLALAVLVESALLVTVTVWLPAAAGAVYNPLLEIVPTVEFPPLTPSTDHCTLALVVPVTVAVNFDVVFTTTLDDVGLMLTATAVTVTAALALWVESAFAVIETV
jgi:hypothetical protein